MAFLTVGIHENLRLSSKTTINEYGTLELHYESNLSEASILNSVLEGTKIESIEGSARVYGVDVLNFEKNPKSIIEILTDLQNKLHICKSIAKIYATDDEVNKYLSTTSMFHKLIPHDIITDAKSEAAKTAVKSALARLTQKDFLDKVSENIFKIFIGLLNSKKAFEAGAPAFRQKFPRTSATNHFPSISSSTYDLWIEPMDVPKDQSKVVWTEWEIKNNRNSGVATPSDKPKTSTEDTKKAADLFSAPEDSAAPDLTTPVEEQPVVDAEVVSNTEPIDTNPPATSSAGDLFS